MRLPTIHLNGTSRERLLEQINEARSAGRIFMEKLAEASPNGRDYYPQGHEAIQEAVREHAQRLGKLESIDQELAELQMHIYEAGR